MSPIMESTMTAEELAEWEHRVQAGALFPIASTIAGSRSELIRAAIRDRFPDGKLPYGAQVALAREFGVTKGVVSEIRREGNYTPIENIPRPFAEPVKKPAHQKPSTPSTHGTARCYMLNGCREKACVSAYEAAAKALGLLGKKL